MKKILIVTEDLAVLADFLHVVWDALIVQLWKNVRGKAEMSGLEERPNLVCPMCKKESYWACRIDQYDYIWLLSDKYLKNHSSMGYTTHVINNDRTMVEIEILDDIQLVICKGCEAKYKSGHVIFDRVKAKMAYWIEKEMMI